jgi:GNAT superfamily N-acetyltransferase
MSDNEAEKIHIRPAASSDLARVIELDERDTGQGKPDYWQDIFDRYVDGDRGQRYFLVAEQDDVVSGFIVGEIRAWEFGSTPSGWVFAINVSPDIREQGIASQLFDAICECFKDVGIHTVRTMISRNDPLNLSFFRSQGLSAGPYIQLEMHLDE